ncbi:MAG: LysR family transcriptional regulator [Methylophilales bacterium]|nr:LysR family transcriptional regulator [Methylophilales bacterium]
MSQPHIKIRIPYGKLSAIGPGKAVLLDAIVKHGSISAAAKSMGMSYKRAWDLVSTMNQAFLEPLVSTATGGAQGGGAQLTTFGLDVLRRYQALESKAAAHIESDLHALLKLLAK